VQRGEEKRVFESKMEEVFPVFHAMMIKSREGDEESDLLLPTCQNEKRKGVMKYYAMYHVRHRYTSVIIAL